MKAVSDLLDNRINSRNILVELTIGEYLDFAKDILDKNEYQRRRVRSSKTVYSLLRSDLAKGCIMPPIVLAITADLDGDEPTLQNFEKYLQNNQEHLVILDGLQRTYTILDLVQGLKDKGDEVGLEVVYSSTIRAEFYIGLNRLGILYRMLTLNTGQSPMSLRQQIEILYLDYATVAVDNIELIREADDKRATSINQYNFRDIIDGFISYLDRDELPIDRADILENIRSLEKLADENQDTDLFMEYVNSWHKFIQTMYDCCGETEVSGEFRDEFGTPFGKNVIQVFKKSQAMSGFGASIGKLKDFELIAAGFNTVSDTVKDITIDNPDEFLHKINKNLLWIKNNTKKIGNAQRSFFHYFFRGILNPEDDSYKNPYLAADTALRKYQSQNM